MMNELPRDASPPISEEEAAAILKQLLSETEMLLEQEQCPEDWLRVQALRLAIQKIGSGNQVTQEQAPATRRSGSAEDTPSLSDPSL